MCVFRIMLIYFFLGLQVCRSEHEVEQVMESELDPALCHDTLLRNIMFASQAR
jgi:hypothetical protein